MVCGQMRRGTIWRSWRPPKYDNLQNWALPTLDAPRNNHICKNTPFAKHHLCGKVCVFTLKSGEMIQLEEHNWVVQLRPSINIYIYIFMNFSPSLSLSRSPFYLMYTNFFSMCLSSKNLHFNDHLGKPAWNTDAKLEIVLDTFHNLERNLEFQHWHVGKPFNQAVDVLSTCFGTVDVCKSKISRFLLLFSFDANCEIRFWLMKTF